MNPKPVANPPHTLLSPVALADAQDLGPNAERTWLPPATAGVPIPSSDAWPTAIVSARGNAPTAERPSPPHASRRFFEQRWMKYLPGWDPAWLFSAALHLLVLILLSFVFFASPSRRAALSLEFATIDGPAVEESAEFTFSRSGSDEGAAPGELARELSSDGGGFTLPHASPVAAVPLTMSEAATSATGLEGLSHPLATRGGGLAGRQGTHRRDAALGGGGTVASESCVELGLAWLAAHQLSNGSWAFDLQTRCPQCGGQCQNSGTNTSTTASTGLALLCFLGAGYTHQEGPYQEVVADGLYYLQQQMQMSSRGGDLRDQNAQATGELPLGVLKALSAAGATRYDSMYSHGIATLALTEAYAMTRDKTLREPAQQAINFIVNAQFVDGGWRYLPAPDSPGPGDMTVSGWQITSLKSGMLGGLEIPYEIWERIDAYLNGMQGEALGTYLYLRGERGTNATTAVGLLCRMIRGWPRDAKPLNAGIALLGGEQPDANNMYFNFYASQVLHHAGGNFWEKWNPRMRDYLVETQASEGHEKGSWYFGEAHSSSGGRLYTTAMAIMTLEVYYRYMPLYQQNFVDAAP